MSLRIETLPPVRVATMRYVGPYSLAISDFWQSFNHARFVIGWIGESYGIALEGESYGVTIEDRAATNAHVCRFDAGVAVPSNAAIDAPFVEQTLPGGRYAVVEFLGSPREIGRAWFKFLSEELPANGLSIDPRPSLEWHRATDCTRPDGSFSCALCVAVT
jgi:AraC family transcriptional regulator